jgi:hypothetical protein
VPVVAMMRSMESRVGYLHSSLITYLEIGMTMFMSTLRYALNKMSSDEVDEGIFGVLAVAIAAKTGVKTGTKPTKVKQPHVVNSRNSFV